MASRRSHPSSPSSRPRPRAATTPAPTRKPAVRKPEPFILPARDWDRATILIKLFIATGRLKDARAQSMLLIADPGSGKSELLERFNKNPQLEYASDMTVQGLYPIIHQAREGRTTHIVATEFQKFFLRKAYTAQHTLSSLCQFMEEGLGKVRVGKELVDFGGAQGGLIGAMTSRTAAKWENTLAEYGFWSRCAAFEWQMSGDELRKVMRKISDGLLDDLTPVIVNVPDKKVSVKIPVLLSRQVMDYTVSLRPVTPLRVFSRFRALAMAAALLDGRDVVHARDVETVFAFNHYWQRVKRG